MSLSVAPRLPSPTPGAHAAPGREWAKRFELVPSMKEMLDSAPVMKIHKGEVKLNAPKIEEIKGPADAPTNSVIEQFRLALSKIQTPVCYSPIPAPSSVCKKRLRESEDAEDDDCVMCAPVGCARPSEDARAGTTNASAVVVPVGVCPGDRITFYDRKNRMLTHQYATVPEGTAEGEPIPNYREPICSAEGCHVLMVDGENGVLTAARQKTQHAIRLHVHKKHCRNPTCNVLGCRDDSYEAVFKSEGMSESKKAYEAYWSRKRGRRR